MSRCRVCGCETPERFLALGPSPLANRFLKKEYLELPEPYFPLDVYFCTTCGLVQLIDVVPAATLFGEYPYMTGASAPMRDHFAALAADLVRQQELVPDDLVVDIGSNDGTTLSNFKRYELRVLGVEPASNIAALAMAAGIDTRVEFFGAAVAESIRRGLGTARVILGTNVFAHVHDLDDFLRGVTKLLSPDGVFIIEVPYLVDMLEKTEFDTIYHEHLSYFAVRPLQVVFGRHGMRIVRLEHIVVHGGSIRVFVQNAGAEQAREVAQFLQLEAQNALDSLRTYHEFAQRVHRVKEELVALLSRLKADGARVVGYGAPAKGNTLLNFCKIGADLLEYIIDTTPFKQGCFTPGTHIPIFPEDRFHADHPDYALLLAWNYAEEIIAKETKFRRGGGKFIIPIPQPMIV